MELISNLLMVSNVLWIMNSIPLDNKQWLLGINVYHNHETIFQKLFSKQEAMVLVPQKNLV